MIFMLFMLFMIFGAFDVIVRRPRRPGDQIDRIIRRHHLIHGTWHILSEASSGTAASTGGRHYARDGVFVVRSVLGDNEADKIQSVLRLRRRPCRSLRR